MIRLPAFTALALALGIPAIAQQPVVLHKTVKVGDLDIFYREAGPKDAPAILLLHGFPTSSQMFRNLIPALADKYRVVAPDYPGYGHSSMPPRDKFAYTFDNLAEGDRRVHREGRPDEVRPLRAGLRRTGRLPAGVAHPERVTAIVVQNGNAYDEGLDNDFWKPIKAYWQEPNSQEKRDALREPAHLRGHPVAVHDRGRRIPSWSARTARPTTSSCSTARATTRSSSTCSSATAATRRSTRSGRSTSASTSRRC